MSRVSPATQDHLPIAGIQDGVVIMNDGSIRAVLQVEPVNFELKSEEEQNAIIYSYQAFLNSLDFPIQILVQSKRLDLEQYLVKLQESQRNVSNELLRIQIEDYTGFVRQLISVANIMAKRFYVIISYASYTPSKGLSQLGNLIPHAPSGPILDQAEFDRLCSEAFNRAGILASGLARLGSKSKLLETQELIELFYTTYNPDVAAEERLSTVTNLNSGVVTAPHLNQTAAPDLPQPPQAPTPQ